MVILCTCVFAGMGYHYLTYRNMLMQNAVVKSGQMSVRMFVDQLEEDIIALEKKMILEIAFQSTGGIENEPLAVIGAHYPLIDQLFVHEHDRVPRATAGHDENLRNWLIRQLDKELARLSADALTLRHFSGTYAGRPVQAGFIQLQKRTEAGADRFLVFTLDLDYIRNELLPENKRPVHRSLPGITVRDAAATGGGVAPTDPFTVEASFHDILPFWNISSRIDNLGMSERSRMELIIYSYIVLLVLLLIILSVYFIWKQVQHEQNLSQVKSQMISHVSHELKTPLSLIRMYTETLMLGRVAGQTKIRDYYRIILSECDHLHLLINNTLDFSSIEKGMKEYHFTRGNIVETVQNIMSHYSYYLKQHGFSFRVDIDDNIPPFDFDQLAMNQVIGNLLDNAMKFSPDEKKIHVRLLRKPDCLQLEITDHGIGIKAEALGRIFESYSRLSNRFRGSGIGLSLVKHAVEAHGGTVYALSREELGSTFVVTLPLPEVGDAVQG